MNNYRAGLYSFISTTTWLHETGMASPPLLVMLGLTLPDSRIMSGIASIGLTLANIAIILPHLRQPILDSMHAVEGVLTPPLIPPKSTQDRIMSPVKSYAPLSVGLPAERPTLPSPSPCKREHQSPPLVRVASVKSVRSIDPEPPNAQSDAALQTILSPPAGDNPILPQTYPSLDGLGALNECNVTSSSSFLFAWGNPGPVYIPLPVPDEEEVAFFDTGDATFSDSDPGEECSVFSCEQDIAPEEDSLEDQGVIEDVEQNGRLIELRGAQECIEVDGTAIDVVIPITDGKLAPTSSTSLTQEDRNSLVQATVPVSCLDLPARGGPIESAGERHSLNTGKDIETPAGKRPESLEFIPQSVLRRYPSALVVSAGRQYVGHEPRGHVSLAPLHVVVHDSAMLLDGTRPRVDYATLPDGHWCASILTEAHPGGRLEGRGPFSVNAASVQREDPVERQSAVQEQTPIRKNSTSRRRLGVLGRAALRDRRSIAQKREDDGDDSDSTSNSDSDLDDSDSQYSSGSSEYEGILPHILGADLIAAIDANSESGLNLAGTRGTKRTALNAYEDFLISDDSVADVSMIMHNISSNDDASDGEIGAHTTDRSLTYEDIQLWASGVVQKCVREVCRSRTPAAPLSPSQASDVCAERPSGSGVSQCPLAGLHCKLAAATCKDVSGQSAKELPAPHRHTLAPTSTLPSRKPLQVRNLRDIPEFVPRQRQIQMIRGRVEGPRRFNMRSAIDVTRDAATQVIARMESQAGFSPREWPAGTEGRRMVNMAGGRHGTLGRCA